MLDDLSENILNYAWLCYNGYAIIGYAWLCYAWLCLVMPVTTSMHEREVRKQESCII